MTAPDARAWTDSEIERLLGWLSDIATDDDEVISALGSCAAALAAFRDCRRSVGIAVDCLVMFHGLHPEALTEDAIRAAFKALLPVPPEAPARKE